MESEVELKGGRGADPRMIASRTKKGNGTMELVGVKLKSNKEREAERNEARGADRTDSRRETHETMMATILMATMALIGILAALASNGRKKNERARPKDERGDCLSHRANLKIETWILNVVAVAMCENAIVERMLRALELQANVWPWIEVRRSWKKIGKSRRNTIGLSGSENDRQLIYSKAQDYCRGIKRIRAMELIGSKSKTKKNKIGNHASYVEIYL